MLIGEHFGPIDWDVVQPSEEEARDIVSSVKPRDRVAEANMFGPLDWAFEVESGQARLEEKHGTASEPALVSAAPVKVVSWQWSLSL